jgi:hypothetical protein
MTSKITFTTVLLAILTIFANPFTSFAQNQSVSISASYPIPIGDTFYSNYDGLINSGLKYSKSVGSNISINGSFNYVRSKITLGSTNQITTYSNFYQFLVSASREIKISNGLTFSPEAGIGYSRLNFRNNDSNNDLNENGFVTEVGLQLEKKITNNFSLGFESSYNLILLGEPEQARNTAYNKEMHSINIGFLGTFYF